jgi:hypothetical protein
MRGDSGAMDPSTRRVLRFGGVFILAATAVTYVIYGIVGQWPSGAPWIEITMVGLAITFLLPPRDQKRPAIRAFSWLALTAALGSAIVALVLSLKGLVLSLKGL